MPIFPPENQAETKTKTKTKTIVKAALIAAGIGLAAAGIFSWRQLNSRARLNRLSPRTPVVSAPAAPIVPVNPRNDIKIELDTPGYIAKELRQPQKLFAGRALLITSPRAFNKQEVSLTPEGTNTAQVLSIKNTKGPSAFVIDIPSSVPAGRHTLSIALDDNEKQDFLINVQAEIKPQRLSAPSLPQASATELEQKVIKYQGKICGDDCYWEAVLTGASKNSKQLFFVGGRSNGSISRSSDGGRSWTTEAINDIGNYPHAGVSYCCDPKIAALPDGSFYLSGLFKYRFRSSPQGTSERIGGILYEGGPSGRLDPSFFQDISYATSSGGWFFADYPKLAVDNARFALYISSAFTWLEETKSYVQSLFVSRNNGETFDRYNIPGFFIESMAVGADGTLYGVTSGMLMRFLSFNPLKYDTVRLPMPSLYIGAKTFSNSQKSLSEYNGPEIVVDDVAASPHKGRLYIVWAQPEKKIIDENFEYKQFGYNYDIFVSYSDNRGDTWSMPVKANDDIGAGDQFFPSAEIDSNGRLHIVFLDHRNNQELAFVDAYYTSTADGVSFSKNIKVNNASIPIGLGSRVLGDYLDMVMPYPDKVYIAYPCGANGNNTTPSAACLTEIDPTYAYAPLAPGDVNKNGRVDIGDALFIAQYLAGKRQLDYSQQQAADVYSDGKITKDDADVIAQYNVGIIKKLPCVYLAGDVNCDGNIDCQDLSALNSMFKDKMTPSVVSDVNGDGQRATLGDIQKLVDIFGEKGITNCEAAASTPFSEKWSDVSINASCNPNKFNVGFVLITLDINSSSAEKSLSLLQELRSDFVNYFYEATYKLASANVSDIVVTTKGAEGGSNGGVSILEAAKELISTRGDKFDFIATFTTYDTWNNNRFDQNYFSFKNNVKNIGVKAIVNDQEKEIFNQSALAGSSGTLKGVSFHDDIMLKLCDKNPTINGQPCGVGGLLHELGHQWCCYAGENFIGNGSERIGIIQEGQHFYQGLDNYPDTADPLGSYHWIPNGDETYRQQTAGYNIRYHPIFLYLMGLLPKYEYDTKFQIFNAGVFGGTLDINKATKYKTVSVNDVIRIMGQRSCGN